MSPSDVLQRTNIAVDGMTCAACSARIERKLNKLDGVDTAVVNFANGRASVKHVDQVDPEQLHELIRSMGYGVIEHDQTPAQTRESDLWRRLVVAICLTIPVMILSMVGSLHFDGWEWVVAVLSTPVVMWSGWPFHRAAAMNLRHHSTTMDTLVSMGSLAAWFWSAVVLVTGIGASEIYFETAAAIITLILLGKWFESRATRRSGDAIRALAAIGASTAILEDGTEIQAEALMVGQRFRVRPGDKIATDGRVVEGHSAVDASMVSGEPVPVDVSVGDEVIGSTINASGSLLVEATRVGSDTALAQIIELVDTAQGNKAEVQRLADRVSAVFVPVALGISALTLVAWLLSTGDVDRAFTAAVAVLIIACPCALGLATPLAMMVGTGRGAQLGVIIKGGEVLEDTREIDAIVVDKTGTLTEGSMLVVDRFAPARPEVLERAASIEAFSEHPIARAIAATIDRPLPVIDFANEPGLGVAGVVDERMVVVGRRSRFDHAADGLDSFAETATAKGNTVVYAGYEGTAEAVFVVSDQIKPTSRAAIAAFSDLGLDVTMMTGDNQVTASAVASDVGISDVIAEVMPADKAAKVADLQTSGKRVAMVGDGINDAPALAQADLGIAIGTGTDVAIEASDLTVVSGDLLAVADAIALARRTLGTIKGNLFWAFAYNAAAIPLAAFGVLKPMVAAAAMGLSSLFVVSNSLRLKRFGGYRGVTAKGQMA